MLHNTKNAVSLGRDLHPIIFALCLVYNTSQGKSQGICAGFVAASRRRKSAEKKGWIFFITAYWTAESWKEILQTKQIVWQTRSTIYKKRCVHINTYYALNESRFSSSA